MEKIAPTDYPVHELISHRWSPRAFSHRPVEPETLHSLLEAARWSASCFNEQPWRYLIVTRDEPEAFARLLETLVEFNQNWAKSAPVLMVSVAKKTFARNGMPNAHAAYDTGQATAALALQATALGLQIHQMAGFSPEKVRSAFSLPEDYEPMAAIALGYPGAPESLPEEYREGETAPRKRHPIASFAFLNGWDRPVVAPPAEEGT
ncbi:MAG: nitroreductase family protein [Capsulimonadales bacterium]|nr:nitroreductase family protein [Capsulimonadales bacterium]